MTGDFLKGWKRLKKSLKSLFEGFEGFEEFEGFWTKAWLKQHIALV